MLAALLALGATVVTALIYVWLTERTDYATVNRRQLDAWAAISAVAFLTAIVYGGAEMRQAALARARQPQVFPAAPAPLEILRVRHPSLDPAAPDSPEGVPMDATRAPESQLLPAGPDDGPLAVVLETGGLSVDERDREPDEPDQLPLEAAPLPDQSFTPLVAATVTVVARLGAPQVRHAPATATSPLAPPVTRPVLVTVVPVLPTRVPPTTVPPPTQEPPPPPAPTPHCGDPNRIDLRIEITEAEADRSGRPLAVRYASRVRNDTDFPLNLTDIVATAQDSRSGSDQFGSDRKGDVTIEPGHWVDIDGTITLEKYPSPFGRSELCISFVPETCGQRSSQRPVSRRCGSIGGL
jgi:hypothetical protein